MKALPNTEETLELVRRALVAHGKDEYEMSAKIGIHPYDDVFFRAMPAYVPGNLACGVKWSECFPGNPKEFGLPQTTGLQIMHDIVTGVPVAVMDCTWLTAMRTPAVTALAAEALHSDAKTFGLFSPDAPCTRAQAMAFPYRAMGQPERDGSAACGDVPADAYYAKAVAWAAARGITSGVGEGLFGSDLSCTRAQIVSFLYRAH